MLYETFPDAVLVATDFSPASRRAVQLALSWLRPDTEVTLLHVIDPGIADSIERVGFASREEVMRRMRQQGEQELVALAAEEGQGRVETMVVEGVPFVEIIRIASDLACALIIMGSHSQSTLENVLFGTTAEKVVRGSRQPVLCIP